MRERGRRCGGGRHDAKRRGGGAGGKARGPMRDIGPRGIVGR